MSAREAIVEVTDGPGKGKRVVVDLGARAVVGRGAAVEVAIPEDKQLSRAHAELAHTDEGLHVRDLGSKHGTLLDGRLVPAGGLTIKIVGTLQLGGTTLRVSFSRRKGKQKLVPELPGIAFLERLGEGESGIVWRAFQDPPGRHVAVKLLKLADADAVRRVRREGTLARVLEHPGIVRVLDVLEAGGRTYIVREFVEGVALSDALKKGPLPWTRAVELGAEIAAALAHAHERGVVHRDVKPSNIFIETSTGSPRLADFDLAKGTRATIAGTQVTKTGDGLGSTYFFPPEQLRDARDATDRADVYGLGATLYNICTGEPPFLRIHPDHYYEHLFGSGPVPVREIAPSVPARTCEVIAKAMAVEPTMRPAAKELEKSLRALLRRRTGRL